MVKNGLFGRRCSAAFFAATLLLAGCQSDEQKETAQEMADFGDYAICVSDSSGDVVYSSRAGLAATEGAKTAPSNYFAVCGNDMYYATTNIGFETGEVEDPDFSIMRRDLSSGKEEEILSLAGVSYFSARLQSGKLYCDWFTANDEENRTVVDLSTKKSTDIVCADGVRVEALTEDGYYYSSSGNVYFVGYDGTGAELFCTPEGEVLEMCSDGDSLYVAEKLDGSLRLMCYEKGGEKTRIASNLASAAGLSGINANIVKLEGATLYYELSANSETSTDNMFLVRMDLKDGTQEICGSWYMP